MSLKVCLQRTNLLKAKKSIFSKITISTKENQLASLLPFIDSIHWLTNLNDQSLELFLDYGTSINVKKKLSGLLIGKSSSNCTKSKRQLVVLKRIFCNKNNNSVKLNVMLSCNCKKLKCFFDNNGNMFLIVLN